MQRGSQDLAKRPPTTTLSLQSPFACSTRSMHCRRAAYGSPRQSSLHHPQACCARAPRVIALPYAESESCEATPPFGSSCRFDARTHPRRRLISFPDSCLQNQQVAADVVPALRRPARIAGATSCLSHYTHSKQDSQSRATSLSRELASSSGGQLPASRIGSRGPQHRKPLTEVVTGSYALRSRHRFMVRAA